MILNFSYDILEHVCSFLDLKGLTALIRSHPKLLACIATTPSLFKNVYLTQVAPLSVHVKTKIADFGSDWRSKCKISIISNRLRSRGFNDVTQMTGYLSCQLTTNQMIGDYIIMALPRSATLTLFNSKIRQTSESSQNGRLPPILVSSDSEITFISTHDSHFVVGDSLGVTRMYRMMDIFDPPKLEEASATPQADSNKNIGAANNKVTKISELFEPNFRDILALGRQIQESEENDPSGSRENRKVRYTDPSPISCLKFDEHHIITGNNAGDLTVQRLFEVSNGYPKYRLKWISQRHDKKITCIQHDHKIVVSGDDSSTVLVHSLNSGRCLFHLEFNALGSRSSLSRDSEENNEQQQLGVSCLHFDCKRLVIGYKNGLIAIAFLDRMARSILNANENSQKSSFTLKPIVTCDAHNRSITCCQLLVPCLFYSEKMLDLLDQNHTKYNTGVFKVNLEDKGSANMETGTPGKNEQTNSTDSWKISHNFDTDIWPKEDISNIQVMRDCMLSGSNDRLIKLINTVDGGCYFTFSGHTAPIIAIQFAWNEGLENILRPAEQSEASQDLIATSSKSISTRISGESEKPESLNMDFLKRSWSSLHDASSEICNDTVRYFWSMSRDGSVIKWDLVNGSVLSVKLSMQASFLALMVLLRE